jgi:hypothetical protein
VKLGKTIQKRGGEQGEEREGEKETNKHYNN